MSDSPSIASVILVSVVTSVVTAAATVVVMQRMQPTAGTERVAVPDLAGLTQDDARVNLQARGLVLQISSRRPDKYAAPGTIITQSLLPGTKVERGTAVPVVLASDLPTVPDVKGRSAAEATLLLEQAGFKIAVGDPVPHDSVPKGQIASQVPSADTQLEPGRTVTVVISDGPRLAEVPKLVGLSINRAKKAIEDAGFKVGTVRWDYDADWGPYAVIRQSPKAGKQAKLGSAVELTANEGE